MNLEHAFFIPIKNIFEEKFVLNKSESNHAVRVVRLKKDEKLILLDGLGTGYKAIIKNVFQDRVEGTITSKIKGYGEDKISINVALGIINRARFENLIEKCTELGVDSFHPLLLKHNKRKTINIDRCKKIVMASAKQCHRSRFPKIFEPKDLKSLLSLDNMKFIAANMEAKKKLPDINFKGRQSLMLLIGPEGDFSLKEMNFFKKNEVELFNLGNRRLRSETAAIKAVSILNYKLNYE